MTSAACSAPPGPQRLLVEDIDVDGVHIRVFRPPGEAPKPAVIYFHGGGWVLGSCETHDDMCAEMADQGRLRGGAG